jgi:hypothetical protein
MDKRRRPNGARGHEHEAKEYDLPLIRQGSARGGALRHEAFFANSLGGELVTKSLRGGITSVHCFTPLEAVIVNG